MPGYAYSRLETGLPVSGVVQIDSAIPVGVAIEHILLRDTHCAAGEGERQAVRLPLR
jgi:hypothetical protein